MKFRIFILSILVIGFFGSCKKDLDPVDNVTKQQKNTMSFTIDGVRYDMKEVDAGSIDELLTIGGHDGKHDLEILLDVNIAVGSYDTIMISSGIDGVAEFTNLNITKLNFEVLKNDPVQKFIKGKFTVNYSDFNTGQPKVSDGEFAVYYVKF